MLFGGRCGQVLESVDQFTHVVVGRLFLDRSSAVYMPRARTSAISGTTVTKRMPHTSPKRFNVMAAELDRFVHIAAGSLICETVREQDLRSC
jgi:hypothetical protein